MQDLDEQEELPELELELEVDDVFKQVARTMMMMIPVTTPATDNM